MFPSGFIETAAAEEETDEGVDFVFNYETGQHELIGTKITLCDSVESVRQYIQNVLRTPADEYKVYTKKENSTFGLSVYKYIGERTLPIGYLNSELKREVTELCLLHPLIADVTDWTGVREKRGLSISFTVTLTDNSLISVSQTITATSSYYLGTDGTSSTGCSCGNDCTCSCAEAESEFNVYKGSILGAAAAGEASIEGSVLEMIVGEMTDCEETGE